MSRKYPGFYDEYDQEPQIATYTEMAYAPPEFFMGCEATRVVFQNTLPDRCILEVYVEEEIEIPDYMFIRELGDKAQMKIKYNETEDSVSIFNQSKATWTISMNGTKWTCQPGQNVKLETGMIIIVFPGKYELVVELGERGYKEHDVPSLKSSF